MLNEKLRLHAEIDAIKREMTSRDSEIEALHDEMAVLQGKFRELAKWKAMIRDNNGLLEKERRLAQIAGGRRIVFRAAN